MLPGACTAAIVVEVMGVYALGGDAIAFFGDGFGQSFAWLRAVYVNAVGGTVDVDFGLWIKLLYSGFHGALAVATGHAGDS